MLPCRSHAKYISRTGIRTQLAFVTLFLFVFLSPLAHGQNGSRERRAADSSSSAPAPTVALRSDTQIITLCPEDAERARTEVRLTAETTGYSSPNNLRYSWRVNGGNLRDEGGTAVWDLAGVVPGTYIASLDVDNNTGTSDPVCRAFTSAVVVARPCQPVRLQCPIVTLNCPEAVEAGQPVSVTANISGAPADISPIFNWTVTGGTIINGQGTSAISIDTAGLSGGTFTASVQVSGFDPTCPLTTSCAFSTTPPPLPRKFDEFPSISFDDDKARLDNLAIELQNDPTARGFVIVHPAANARPDQATRLGDRARRYLTNSRGIDPSRIVVTSGSSRARATYELYIVPVGATPPSVDR